MLTTPVKTRILITLCSNITRGGLSFLTGLIVARSLGPKLYGDFFFLLGSFLAVMQLIELGTSHAFYTFLSNRSQGLRFLVSYILWQLFQFLFALLLIGFLIPQEVLDQIWLGNEKRVILLSFMAVFMKVQAWKTIVQLGESNRLTLRVQIGEISIVTIHLLIIFVLWKMGFLSISLIFTLIIFEYLFAIFITFNFVYVPHVDTGKWDGKEVLKKYYAFCLPLVLCSILGFLEAFSKTWMLQNFGAAEQQAYYGVSYQFATVSILLTSSILNIFWKEIAEAHENGNLERIHYLYKKTSRFLFFSGVIICGFFIFWSEEIVKLALGQAYLESSRTLIIMFIFTVHQALGQITGAMLLATDRTPLHLRFNALSVLMGLLIAYFFLAPKDSWIPGLELGAMGMALQMVLLQFVVVNIKIWWIDKIYGWKSDISFQLVGLGIGFAFGWLAFNLAGSISSYLSLNIIWKFGISLVMYGTFSALYLWNFPGMAGLSRPEIRSFIMRFVVFFKESKNNLSNLQFL